MPDGAKFRLDGAIDLEAKEHVEMVLLDDGLDAGRQVLDKVLRDAAHLRLKRDLLVLAVQLLVQLLFVDLGALRLGLLLVDLHAAVVVVHLHVLLHSLLEARHHGLALSGQLQVEVGRQLGQVDVVTL